MDPANPIFPAPVNPTTPWHLSQPLYQRLPNDSNLPYRICDVTQQDPEWETIHKLFQLYKPNKYSIGTVRCIHNTALVNQFQASIVIQEQEAKASSFAPKGPQEEPTLLRQKTMQRWTQLTQSYTPFSIQWPNQRKDSYTHTKVIPLWHGTKAAICESICATGFTTFGKHEIIHGMGKTQNTDIGFFGSGIYFTTSAKYAASVYSDGNLILAWVSMREPYPVVTDQICTPPHKPSDMKKLEGLGAYQNYNAHYIPVISVNPSDENCAIYYPCTDTQNPAWDEIVVFQKSQAVPSFWIVLQPDLLKSPTLLTVQHLLDHVLNLLETTAVQQNPSFMKLLEQKSDILIKLHSNDPLTSQDQEFYNWSLKLLDETGKVRSYVQNKLQGMQTPSIPLSPTTSHSPSPSLTLEQKYQEAKSYETGEGKAKDLGKAINIYEELAIEGYAPAQCSLSALGFCYQNGMGVKKDEAQAVVLYQKAADQSHSGAQYNLGFCYQNGIGVKKDEAQAVVLYQKAADQGHSGAQYNLGVCYHNGIGVKKDEVQAAIWYQKVADQGHADAQCNLGFCYQNGIGVKKDETQAAIWYQKATDQGHADAQCNLGFCYQHGIGVKKDETQAAFWYQKAADQGHAQAQFNLGICYQNGIGVKKDEVQEVFWYQKAADQGHADAQCNLGFCYQKAADQGYANAQCALGICYQNGTGVKKDETQAAFWYQKAADQGHAEAQCNLGVCYENGIGVKKDKATAIQLFRKAAEQGHAGALLALQSFS